MSTQTLQLLVIGHHWPEPAATAAGRRMLQLLKYFKSENFQITFASSSIPGDHAFDLNSIGVRSVRIKLNDSSFDHFIKELDPQVAVFDRFMTEEQFGWRLAKYVPGCIRILNTEDLHSLRSVREVDLKSGDAFDPKNWLASEITLREIASIYRCDLSLIISGYELELLAGQAGIPEHLLYYLPLEIKRSDDLLIPGFDKRSDFVFIGNGQHKPNIDAIEYLIRTIWPLIREKLPGTNLNIYGAYLPKRITQLHNPEKGIIVHGHIRDSSDVLAKARINLAPIRFGAGLKGKILEAMSVGTPNIATSIGWEGILKPEAEPQMAKDDPQSFAKDAVEIYSDALLWKERQKWESEIFTELVEEGNSGSDFVLKISELRSYLEQHRAANLIGRMLIHHLSASTMYLAKWIEEKNTNKRQSKVVE